MNKYALMDELADLILTAVANDWDTERVAIAAETFVETHDLRSMLPTAPHVVSRDEVGEVEHEVPVARARASGGSVPFYPWHEMKSGSSFTVPVERRKNVSSAGGQYVRRHGLPYRVLTRLEPDDPSRVRVWFVDKKSPRKRKASGGRGGRDELPD